MPTIVMLGKVKIQVFADDHHPPHFHVVTPEHEVLVRLSDLQILAGRITRRDFDSAMNWVAQPDNRRLVDDVWQNLNRR